MSNMNKLNDERAIIEAAFEGRNTITPENAGKELLAAIEASITGLEQGSLRVAEPVNNEWQVNEWLKKAVLLYFRVRHNQVIDGSASRYYDKVPLRWAQGADDDISACGARIVPPATVRRGAFIGHDAVLMPSYVNIGAFVGERSMVDTWATVGSCAQIGEHVHLSGGVGIGGVLEPLQATPTIIEDECFIGARSEVVEGVIIGKGSVLSMGVYIGKSTRIYDRESGEIMYGRVPPGSVVVPGSLPAKDGSYT
ncbi:MAG: 2,3,4,5-tetrahydropyridine-2,6-dicarboxylate N-succinyltransferase, partial [Xanthomonadales bacterium]|nr:2,3,4,5-tetrahydropyridine-2,6-dicarboxylate N-succinyltransferase [Xanthomonadales bacterium]